MSAMAAAAGWPAIRLSASRTVALPCLTGNGAYCGTLYRLSLCAPWSIASRVIAASIRARCVNA